MTRGANGGIEPGVPAASADGWDTRATRERATISAGNGRAKGGRAPAHPPCSHPRRATGAGGAPGARPSQAARPASRERRQGGRDRGDSPSPQDTGCRAAAGARKIGPWSKDSILTLGSNRRPPGYGSELDGDRASSPATNLHNSGMTCDSNHGRSRNQRWLRGLGCGSGKHAGAYSCHAATVSPRLTLRRSRRCHACAYAPIASVRRIAGM